MNPSRLAAGAALGLGLALVPSPASADHFQSSGAPDLVVPLDAFNIAITGISASNASGFVVAPLTVTFSPGQSQSFVGVGIGGQTVTVTTNETIGATTTTDTITIGVPQNLLPPGTTIGGAAVTTLQLDLGRGNAGTNLLDFALPITNLLTSGTILYNLGNFSVTPVAELNGTNTALSAMTGITSLGNGDLSNFGIRSFTLNFTYSNVVPEPATWAFLATSVAVGLAATLRRRRAF